MKNDHRIGALFPIRRENVEELFCKRKDVFIKFTSFKLVPEEIILFYVSGKGGIIGQGQIERVEEMDSESAWTNYGNRIYLDRAQYELYCRASPITGKVRTRKLKVFLLKDKQRFRRRLVPLFKVTPAGRYITKAVFDKMIKRTVE